MDKGMREDMKDIVDMLCTPEARVMFRNSLLAQSMPNSDAIMHTLAQSYPNIDTAEGLIDAYAVTAKMFADALSDQMVTGIGDTDDEDED